MDDGARSRSAIVVFRMDGRIGARARGLPAAGVVCFIRPSGSIGYFCYDGSLPGPAGEVSE